MTRCHCLLSGVLSCRHAMSVPSICQHAMLFLFSHMVTCCYKVVTYCPGSAKVHAVRQSTGIERMPRHVLSVACQTHTNAEVRYVTHACHVFHFFLSHDFLQLFSQKDGTQEGRTGAAKLGIGRKREMCRHVPSGRQVAGTALQNEEGSCCFACFGSGGGR